MLDVVASPAGDVLVGETWMVAVDAASLTGADVVASDLTVTVTSPSGAVTHPTMESDPLVPGRWTATVPLAGPGRWLAVVSASWGGAVADAVFAAETGGPPTMSQLKAYMGFDAESHDDGELALVMAAEVAAQSRVCGVRVMWPADLRMALLRRCTVALAKKGIPLSMIGVDSEAGATRIPMWDAEIRRLEGPYRRLTCG